MQSDRNSRSFSRTAHRGRTKVVAYAERSLDQADCSDLMASDIGVRLWAAVVSSC
jgi:hypothetical protein